MVVCGCLWLFFGLLVFGWFAADLPRLRALVVLGVGGGFLGSLDLYGVI